MEDKKIFFQMLEREIDKIIINFGPMAQAFAGPIKNYIFNFLSPYVDMFFMGGTELNVDIAGEFIKSGVSDKVNDFISKYKEEKNS